MNKIKFGLRNVHISKITINEKGEYEYGTPFRIPGAVNLSLSPVGDTNDFYADDLIYYSDTDNQGYEGDLEIALLTEQFRKEILNEETDANGALIENADAVISPFALGFEVQGDKRGRRTWLYNCSAARPNQDASTKESSKTPSTETLSVKSMPRLSDRAVKVALPLGDTNKEVYEKFFDSVYEKVAETTPASEETPIA